MLNTMNRERNNAIHLTLRQLKALDDTIRREFDRWIRRAPESYKDHFLSTRYPVAITSLYGQNQPRALDGEEEEEEFGNWTRNRDFSRIKYLNIALATHLRCDIPVLIWH